MKAMSLSGVMTAATWRSSSRKMFHSSSLSSGAIEPARSPSSTTARMSSTLVTSGTERTGKSFSTWSADHESSRIAGEMSRMKKPMNGATRLATFSGLASAMRFGMISPNTMAKAVTTVMVVVIAISLLAAASSGSEWSM
jgi:hypothetical protein